jgi:hypothetical protein
LGRSEKNITAIKMVKTTFSFIKGKDRLAGIFFSASILKIEPAAKKNAFIQANRSIRCRGIKGEPEKRITISERIDTLKPLKLIR